MHFSVSDGIDLGSGWGLVVVMVVVSFVLSVWHYHSVERPEEKRELADEREAEARERAAIHEHDVPGA